MKIEKLPSGSYRVRITKNKQNYSLVYPYKPTEKQAYSDILELVQHPESKYSFMTFEEAYHEFVKMKDAVLSPSTFRGYQSLFNQVSEAFKKKPLRELDSVFIQKEVNRYAKTHKPKSTYNFYGFISSILGTFIPQTNISASLPQNIKEKPYIPSEEDVKKLFEYFKGTEYEAMVILLSMGLRRSEALAITLADFDVENNTITINKGKVQNEKNEWIVKPFPKNDSSNRTISVPAYLTDLVVRKGYVYKMHPNMVYKKISHAEDVLGLPHFSIHKLRHHFVSYAHSLGISDANIMTITGHANQKTLDKIYRHAYNESESKKEMADKIGSLIG